MFPVFAALLIMFVPQESLSTKCESDSGKNGEILEPAPVGSRCVFRNELGYIFDTGKIVK